MSAEQVSPSPPERIDLGDAVLTRLRGGDARSMAAAVAANLAHLRPWIGWGTEEGATLAFQERRCAEAEHLWDAGSDYIYTLREQPDGPVIGGMGLHRRVGPDAIEIGYWLDAGHTGRGLATRGAQALTGHALALPGMRRVEIHTDEQNLASAAVPARLGYRLVGVEDAEPFGEASSGRLQIWVTP